MQEEIMFAEHPECIAGMLFCERMDDNEALVLVGPQQYCLHEGYSRETVFSRDLAEVT